MDELIQIIETPPEMEDPNVFPTAATAAERTLAAETVASLVGVDVACQPSQMPQRLPNITREDLVKSSPANCPKCGAFIERVFVATDDHLPGYWCNKSGCGWMQPLPGLARGRSYNYILTDSLTRMLLAAPMNEEIRAQVHAVMLRPIPRSCKKYEDIIDWIECFYDCDGSLRAGYWEPPPIVPPPRQRNIAIETEVNHSYTELGNCNYSAIREGSSNYEMSDEQLRHLIGEARSFDELVRDIREWFKNEAQENPPDTEQHGFSYDDYEEQDSSNNTYDISTNDIREKLREWMRANMPDRLESIDNQ